MNFRILFFMLFFGCFGLATTSSAQTDEEIPWLQGVPFPIQLESKAMPQIKGEGPNEGNTIEIEPQGGDDYIIYYTPAPDFLGADGFTIEFYKKFNPPFDIEKDTETFLFNIQASMVETKDDFVHLTSEEEIIIDVLANDEASSADLTINLAQVLKGTAVVNDDQTITYTPTEEDKDFIVYSVSDENNTISSSTIYISKEYELEDDSDVKNYKLASGQSQYIILPNDDLTIVEEDLDLGVLEEINSFVYKYTANTNTEGFDFVKFSDSEGKMYQAAIEIIEKYTDEGFVRDDIFYSAANTKTYFNVSENDVYDQYVITEYSDALNNEGDGVFSYTPTPYFTGVKEFSYTADDGFEQETGSITLVINNFKPTNYFEYNLSTPENQPRVIEYEVPLGTEYFEIAALPLHGDVEIFTEEESVDLGCEEGIQKVFAVYTPDLNYTGEDDMIIKYCASDNNLCNNVNITFTVVENDLDDCICIDDCVWPGDANGDGKVSVTDALTIGRFIGMGGAARDDSPFGETYEGVSVDNWNGNQVNGKNLKHADADGDGFITAADLDVVVDNYDDINSIISADVLGVKNLPFLLTTDQTDVDSGEVMILNVLLGNDDFPAIDLHGVAFAVNLPASLVDSASVEVEYLETGYFVKDAPYVSLTHQPSDGIIHTAGTKSNSLGSTGSGIIATISFIVEEDALGIKDPKRSASISNTKTVTVEVSDIVIEDSKGLKYALPNTTLDIVVNGEGEEEVEGVNVYPNPAHNFITVSSKDGQSLNSIEIYTIGGQKVKSVSNINNTEASVSINNLEKGLFIIRTSTSKNSYSTKLIVE